MNSVKDKILNIIGQDGEYLLISDPEKGFNGRIHRSLIEDNGLKVINGKFYVSDSLYRSWFADDLARALLDQQEEFARKRSKATGYRTAAEVEEFCLKKYGSACPHDLGFGHIVWLHVPFFAMPFSPMEMREIPYLEIPETKGCQEPCEQIYDIRFNRKHLNSEQLELLGINFDVYEHKYNGSKASFSIKGKHTVVPMEFGERDTE
jgi:hypothetical protein